MGAVGKGKREKADRAFIPGRGRDRDPTDPSNNKPFKFGDIINSALFQDTLKSRLPEGTIFELADLPDDLYGLALNNESPPRIQFNQNVTLPATELQRIGFHETRHVEDHQSMNVGGVLKAMGQGAIARALDFFVEGSPNLRNSPVEKRADVGAEATRILRIVDPSRGTDLETLLDFYAGDSGTHGFNQDSVRVELDRQKNRLPRDHPILQAIRGLPGLSQT